MKSMFPHECGIGEDEVIPAWPVHARTGAEPEERELESGTDLAKLSLRVPHKDEGRERQE